jgi:hypothetical protein
LIVEKARFDRKWRSRRIGVNRRALLIPVWILSATVSVPSPLDRLPRDEAGKIVQRAIAQAGGWRVWASKTTVQLRVTTRELAPDGSVEKVRLETHRYRLQPQLGVRIEGGQAGGEIVWVNNSRFATKVANAAEDFSPAAGLEARDRTFRAEYDFAMPFKLTDPGTHLEYLGKGPFGPGRQADRIRVTYDKGVGDAGGLHTWTYYFDPNTGALLGTHVAYGSGRFEVTEMTDQQSFDGIRLAVRRSHFPADASGKTGPATSETVYQDVVFNAAMADDLFAIPPR